MSASRGSAHNGIVREQGVTANARPGLRHGLKDYIFDGVPDPIISAAS